MDLEGLAAQEVLQVVHDYLQGVMWRLKSDDENLSPEMAAFVKNHAVNLLNASQAIIESDVRGVRDRDRKWREELSAKGTPV